MSTIETPTAAITPPATALPSRITDSAGLAVTQRREGLFRSVGVDALDLHTDRPYDAALVRFFHRRARRMAR